MQNVIKFIAFTLLFISCSPSLNRRNEEKSETRSSKTRFEAKDRVFDLFIGLEATDSKSYLKHLTFNSTTNLVNDATYLQLGFNHQLRGLDINSTGEIYAANFQNGIERLSTLPYSVQGSFTVDHQGDPTYEITKYHSLCFLPNGNFLSGNFRPPSNPGPTFFNEYTSGGLFVRNVYQAPPVGPNNLQVVSCKASTNNDIYLSEGSTSGSPVGGRVLRFTRPNENSGWAPRNSFEMAAFDIAQGSDKSGIWMMAVDLENSFVYISRYRREQNTEFAKLIRCPLDFSQSNCVGVGDDVPGDAKVKSLAVIPDTGGDLLVFTHEPNHGLYRFSPANGTWVLLYDLNSLELGSGVFYKQIWNNPILK